MLREEVLEIERHCKELANLLEVPGEIFQHLITWSTNQIKKEPDQNSISAGFWKQVPTWNASMFSEGFKTKYSLTLRGRLINNEVRYVSKIVKDFEYNYSVKHGNDCEFVKQSMKAELLELITKEFLDFKLK